MWAASERVHVRAPAEGRLHVALHDVSRHGWLGGTEYVHNLVRAVRSLPVEEQPRLTLLQSAWGDPARHDGIASLVESVQAYPSEAKSWWGRLRRLARQASRGNRYRTYAHVLREREVDVIFPLVQAPDQPLPVPWIGWAWDLQHKCLPEYFPPAELARRDAVFAGLAAAAPLIVVSSRSALADFSQFFPGARDRLRVLSFAAVPQPEWYAADSPAVRDKHSLPARFLALPNAFWVHKNHWTAFEAIRRLKADGLEVCLACTGTTRDPRRPEHFSALETFIRTHGLERQIRILGVLPRGEQVQIMRTAAAILQPSLFEGWSTVVEDARALGKRVFLSDLRVHREQDPPAAIYFDPHDPGALAQALRSAWPGLTPGPDLEGEAGARLRQAEIVREFARRFVAIAREGAQLGPTAGSSR